AMIPEDVVVVGESGLKTAVDAHHMYKIGVDAILVGESLVKSKDVVSATKRFVEAGKVK
ncbi:MAG: indole-3-glycerol-phosphate synthase TrpC, partial [Anaerolineae bacterium]|nr:indole-3-glycerol-phosphate synthase TrpC [Anaerolineae bacterium]